MLVLHIGCQGESPLCSLSVTKQKFDMILTGFLWLTFIRFSQNMHATKTLMFVVHLCLFKKKKKDFTIVLTYHFFVVLG